MKGHRVTRPRDCKARIYSTCIGTDTARQWTDAMTRAINEAVGESDPEIAKVMANVLEQMAMGMAR